MYAIPTMELYLPTGRAIYLSRDYIAQFPGAAINVSVLKPMTTYDLYLQSQQHQHETRHILDNDILHQYVAHLKTTLTDIIMKTIGQLKEMRVVSESEDWLTAIEACICHLESCDFDNLNTALDNLENELEIIYTDFNAVHENIKFYIYELREEWCVMCKKYVEFIRNMDDAALKGCHGIVRVMEE